jgi:hypothetical protein
MYAKDREHPSPAGSYLTTLMIWAALTGGDPRSFGAAGWRPSGMEEAEATALQGVAWEEAEAQASA